MAYARPINMKQQSTPPTPIIFKAIENCLSQEKSGAANNQRDNQNKLMLCIKGTPSHLDENSLKSLLCNHGNVTNVYAPKSAHCSYYFAECRTENDFEAVIKGMQNNKYSIRVEPKTGKRNEENVETESRRNNQNSKQENNNRRTDNHNNRRTDNSFDDKNQQRHRRGNDRRNSDNGSKTNNNANSELSQRGRDSKNKLCEKQVSKYIDNTNRTINKSNQIVENKENIPIKHQPNEISSSHLTLGPCRTCKKPSNKICEKCDEFYCSVECQKRDWGTHRFYCFKMPKLTTIINNADNNGGNTENSNIEKNNMSINEIKQLKYTNDFNNRQNHNPSYEFKQDEPRDNGKTSNGTGAVPKQSILPKKIYDSKSNTKPSIANTENGNSKYLQQKSTPQNPTVPLQVPNKSPPIQIINKPMKAAVPKSGQTVILTHFDQTDMVYIRSMEKADNDDYISILNKVQMCSKNSNTLTKLPNVNEYVAAMYDEEIWFRAIVLDNKNPDQIRIAYVDFGNTELKKLSELKELVPECYNLKRYPVIIYLKNLSNIIPNDGFKKYMDNLISEHAQLKILYKTNDIIDNKVVATLYHLETNEDINNKCIELLNCGTETFNTDKLVLEMSDTTKPIQISENISDTHNKPVMFEDIIMVPLPVGENISITIVDQSIIETGFIHCISSIEYKELLYLNHKIKQCAESSNHNYFPMLNEMCIAKFDKENWYRAYCCSIIDENNINLTCPDYGIDFTVSVHDIRQYPKNISLLSSCKSHGCLIDGFLEIENKSEQLGKRLRELLPLKKPIMVPNIECLGDSDFLLHLPHVIDTLTQEGLL